MKSYFSIVYIHPNSLTAEKFAVGLLAFNSEQVFFDFKTDKIDFIDKLFPFLNLKLGVLNALKSIKIELQQPQNNNALINSLFKGNSQLINPTYVNYLHHYSKGIIQFSEINPIAANINASFFQKLFHQYILSTTDSALLKHPHKNFHQNFKKKINSANLKDKMDIDLKLTPQKLNGIYANTQVRMIGKNGVITAAQDIDFTINMDSLGNQLSQWDVLVNALNSFSISKQWKLGDYYVFFNKPEPKSPQEKLLNNIVKQKSSLFKINSVDEVDHLITKIESPNSGFQPLTAVLDSL
jgi:hypothetical protein